MDQPRKGNLEYVLSKTTYTPNSVDSKYIRPKTTYAPNNVASKYTWSKNTYASNKVTWKYIRPEFWGETEQKSKLKHTTVGCV